MSTTRDLAARDGTRLLVRSWEAAGEPWATALIVHGLGEHSGRWEAVGQFQTPWDSFTLDSTVFSHKGVRYILWAQGEPGVKTNSNLYLAPLATPTTLARPPARLTVPTLDWETRGFKVAEGPAPLHRNGRLFISYSASATDDRYCLGLLTADVDLTADADSVFRQLASLGKVKVPRRMLLAPFNMHSRMMELLAQVEAAALAGYRGARVVVKINALTDAERLAAGEARLGADAQQRAWHKSKLLDRLGKKGFLGH